MMSGAGFNGIEALHSRVLMDVEALGEWFRKAILWWYRKRLYPERASMRLKPSSAVY